MFEIDRFIIQAVVREDTGKQGIVEHPQPQAVVVGVAGLKRYLRQLEKTVQEKNGSQQT